MAGKINSTAVIEQLQRSMAFKKSDKEGTVYTTSGHDICDGHSCTAACGYEGYCDHRATRYYNTGKGKAEGRDNKEQRHDYYRRSMRLGYDY